MTFDDAPLRRVAKRDSGCVPNAVAQFFSRTDARKRVGWLPAWRDADWSYEGIYRTIARQCRISREYRIRCAPKDTADILLAERGLDYVEGDDPPDTCIVHVQFDECGHVSPIIDGTIYDLFDPRRPHEEEGSPLIVGWWEFMEDDEE